MNVFHLGHFCHFFYVLKLRIFHMVAKKYSGVKMVARRLIDMYAPKFGDEDKGG